MQVEVGENASERWTANWRLSELGERECGWCATIDVTQAHSNP